MTIEYAVEPNLTAVEFIEVLQSSALAQRRPVEDVERIERMLRGADCIVTARSSGRLVGVARAISDGAYCTYLSDLAVSPEFQGQGIGRELIAQTHRRAGPQSTLILLSAPKARTYYPHIGMQQHDACWIQPPIEGPSQNTAVLQGSQRTSQEGVTSFFDQLVGEYDAAIRRCFPRYDEMLRTLLSYLPKNFEPQRIVELGCGTGNLSMLVAQRFANSKFCLIDISADSLAACRQRFSRPLQDSDANSERGMLGTQKPDDQEFLLKDLREVEFDHNSCDLVISSITLHHLTSAEKKDLFERVHKWLVPGGFFIFADQMRGETEELYSRHMEYWKKQSMAAGSNEEEWSMWMEHQRTHDHHDSLNCHLNWLAEVGFKDADCVWRYLLWSVVHAQKEASSLVGK
ncbi:MAG: GNAT family N-acetyltransferase [Planctomycetales bacterium]|nr:GNAT family N-acetyltransferase [Planctomycetales bacterium]